MINIAMKYPDDNLTENDLNVMFSKPSALSHLSPLYFRVYLAG